MANSERDKPNIAISDKAPGDHRRPLIGKINRYLVLSTGVAALGGSLFGFDTAVISGVTRDLTITYALTPALLGITVASALWGTVLGAAIAGIPGDRFGRRDSLRVLAILYLLSSLGCALAWNWHALLMARLVGGIAIGGSSVLGPMYIAEIAPSKWRGRLVGFFQINVILGILSAFISNYLIGLAGFGFLEWRVKLGVAALPSALFLFLLFKIPRSPRWLVQQKCIGEAEQVLNMIGEDNVQAHLHSILNSLHLERQNEPLFSWEYRLPIFLAISIGVFNQLSGINAVWYYLNDIFARAGFSNRSSNLQAIMVGITNLIAGSIALWLIDRAGRKMLLLIGSVGCAASLFGVAFVFHSGTHPYLLLWFLISFIGFFAFSQGAVIWVYIGEIFPNRVRAKGQSLGSFAHWFTNAAVASIFPIIAVRSGTYPFVFFASMMVLQFFVVLFIYPETKCVPLEAIQERLELE